jgi:hypothetical protein
MKIARSGLWLLMLMQFFPTGINAQYHPPVDQPGTSAMHKDSVSFVSWASSCIIERGFINMVDSGLTYNGANKTTYGTNSYATGRADGSVVSLGDRGTALLSFDLPIVNRPGPDFAVFENSFSDSFLELAFVEVSSDGQHFVRFPSVSLTSENEQVPTFGTVDATKINNLAGKYRMEFGTPFDLDDILDSIAIDLQNITHIRIIDVGGCMETAYAVFDSQGHKVNDPWPTPFDTGGFDLDGLGVIHNSANGFDDEKKGTEVLIYPNPVTSEMSVSTMEKGEVGLKISDLSGRILLEQAFSDKEQFDFSSFTAGLYIARFSLNDGTIITKKIVKN